MGFPVYDYRCDLRNVLVSPQIRSRFLRLEPGQPTQPHTHDLGHEVFLVLSGRAEFEIDGETEDLGPGQMCVALADQSHSIRVLGDEPMTMYLSVTPHIQPTHTVWTEDGRRLPLRFVPSGDYDVRSAADRPLEKLVYEFTDAVESLAESAEAISADQTARLETLRRAIDDGDRAAATAARDHLWGTLFPIFQRVNRVAELWNELAPRAEGSPR
jgi:quercetin dioxygenase-like cupin family protein